MAYHGFVVRIVTALVIGGLIMSADGCGGDESGSAAVGDEVNLSGDGCSASMALGSDGPAVNEVDEPNPERGSIEWRTEAAGGSEIGALAAAGDVVFVGDGTTVSAFTMADGTSRWQQKLDVGDLAPTGEQGDDMVTTIIHQLAVGDLVAVAVTERTVSFLSGGADPTTESADRTVVAALGSSDRCAAMGISIVEGGGGFGFPGALELIDNLVVVGWGARMSATTRCGRSMQLPGVRGGGLMADSPVLVMAACSCIGRIGACFTPSTRSRS